MSELKTLAVENTGQAYLELLEALGVKYFFGAAGSDFPSLIDGFVRRELDGREYPKPLLVTHEGVAMAMAHGYHLATGEPGLVMVHTTPGTANAVGALMNAYRGQIPLVLTAGRTPITESGMLGSRDQPIHWGQESFDQAAMVREFVKWDYELRNFAQLETVVRRAFGIAMAEPKGPVYLTLPREVLAEEHREFSFSTAPMEFPVSIRSPDARSVERLAELIAQSRSPLILTQSVGRNPSAVAALVKLADAFALPVVEYVIPRFVNFPANHPMHLGYDPGSLLGEADLVIVIDSDLPWLSSFASPNPEARIVHIGLDPAHVRYPIWGFRMDLAIDADAAMAVSMLTEALESHRARCAAVIAERRSRLEGEHRRQRESWAEEARRLSGAGELSFEWISHCLGQIKDRKTVFINEYDIVLRHLAPEVPGSSFFSSSAGHLGWGLGAALGVKLGAPDKTVITIVGDGTYIFCDPTAAHMASASLGLPTITIITNNSGWGAVHSTMRLTYPKGWAMRTGKFPLVRFAIEPSYETIVEAFGGHGEAVSSPQEFKAALERALRVVKDEGRQVVINARCKKI
jgi:acetolactate synthase-1/2/3 large subunit